MSTLYDLLEQMIEKGASDLHISTGSPPRIRVDGKLMAIHAEPLNPPETKALCYSVLTDTQKQKFEEQKELDLSYGVPGLGRFRVNIYLQRGSVGTAVRALP